MVLVGLHLHSCPSDDGSVRDDAILNDDDNAVLDMDFFSFRVVL